ncbi:MAG: Gfo/Idh/MocA family oxidoreductase, partial [Planctomycetes bacterium]|nr:Gfo/Idh/MocA family oxidoreductase [Planctomycetota bacterium]
AWMSDNGHILRIAVIGTEAETGPLITSAERLPGIDCAGVPGDSELDGFDAVAYCGSHDDDVPAICDVARSGKHLLVDLAALKTTVEAEAVIAACGEADVQLMIAQPQRFLPAIQAVRQSLDAGELGEPGLLRIHRWTAEPSGNAGQRLLGEIDLANYLFDRPPESIYAVARDSGDSPRFVQVHLGFDGGGMALLDVTSELPEGDDYYSLSLIGADGAAYADDHHNMQLIFTGGSAAAARAQPISLHWTEPLREFVAAIGKSHMPAIGGEAALSALRVTAAVRHSIRSGSAMHWQGENYEPV